MRELRSHQMQKLLLFALVLFYADSACTDTDVNCETCYGEGNEMCARCKQNFYYNNDNVCRTTCEKGKKPTQDDLFFCGICTTADCEACEDNTDTPPTEKCNKCVTGKYFDESKNTCVDCTTGKKDETTGKCEEACSIANCDSCTVGTDGVEKCDKCSASNYLSVDKLACTAECAKGKPNADKMICEACSTSNCEKCDDNNVCSKCAENNYLDAEKKCATTCSKGKPDATSMTCVDCTTQKCHACSADDKCTKCTTGNYLDKDNKCAATCPAGYKPNTETGMCELEVVCTDTNCEKCETADKCTECKETFFLVEDIKKCTAKCGNGYRTDEANKKCLKCAADNCDVCTATECTKCMTGFELKDKKCESSGAKSVIAALLLVALFLAL